MFHMLTCFKVAQPSHIALFKKRLELYLDHLKELQLATVISPVGERQSNTILDTHHFQCLKDLRDMSVQTFLLNQEIRPTCQQQQPRNPCRPECGFLSLNILCLFSLRLCGVWFF